MEIYWRLLHHNPQEERIVCLHVSNDNNILKPQTMEATTKEGTAGKALSIENDFEAQYIEVRKKEDHFYTHEQIALLPEINEAHPHYGEWQIRKGSSTRLIDYLKKTNKPLSILEVGCGNGWLSAKLAAIENSQATGLDINKAELQLGTETFKHIGNLQFKFGDIRESVLAGAQFDAIIFAASAQYFPSLPELMAAALKHLKPNGEVHILDTPFYKKGDAAQAKERTKKHFEATGYPGLAAFYFHHEFSALAAFKPAILYNPFSLTNKLLRKRNPFYWLRITQ